MLYGVAPVLGVRAAEELGALRRMERLLSRTETKGERLRLMTHTCCCAAAPLLHAGRSATGLAVLEYRPRRHAWQGLPAALLPKSHALRRQQSGTDHGATAEYRSTPQLAGRPRSSPGAASPGVGVTGGLLSSASTAGSVHAQALIALMAWASPAAHRQPAGSGTWPPARWLPWPRA